MIISPRRLSWRRWWLLGTGKYSLLRQIEYEVLSDLRLEGDTLDLGGGANTSYRKIIDIAGELTSINISPDIVPTMVGDLNKPLPIASSRFDNILCLNTLEHIKEDTLAISEAFRVLKSGGKFYIIVPFIYRVHGSPFDFHRHTALFWENFIVNTGIQSKSFRIEPLVWDPLSTAFSLVEYSFGIAAIRRFIRPIAMLPALLMLSGKADGDRLATGVGERIADYALGYYLHGQKS
jgi:SAM-dependent methyltransferase